MLKHNQQQFQNWLKMKTVYRSMIEENPMFKNKQYLKKKFQSLNCIKDLIREFRIWCSHVRDNSSVKINKKRKKDQSVINLFKLKKMNYEYTFNSVFFKNDSIQIRPSTHQRSYRKRKFLWPKGKIILWLNFIF